MRFDAKMMKGLDLTITVKDGRVEMKGYGTVYGTVAALNSALISMITDENVDDELATILLGATVEMLTDQCVSRRGREFADKYHDAITERYEELSGDDDDDYIRNQFTDQPVS